MTRCLAVVSLMAAMTASMACVKAGTEPTPVATPTPWPPQAWSGTFTQRSSVVDTVYTGYPPYVTTITGTVTWQTNGTPPEHSMANAAYYAVTAGEMTVTVTGGPCAYEGQAHFTFRPWRPEDGLSNTLGLRSDGYYSVSLDQDVTFPGTQSGCPGRRELDLPGTLALGYGGNLVNGHAQGTMVEEYTGQTINYSWDFAPR